MAGDFMAAMFDLFPRYRARWSATDADTISLLSEEA
jgi:hypothetical protein